MVRQKLISEKLYAGTIICFKRIGMEEFQSQHEEGDLVYKGSLVRKLIYKIEVFREKLIVTFKTGREIEIEY